MRLISFSVHAFQRMGERVALRSELIYEILKRDLFIDIGKEERKSHLMFYSPRDVNLYVAVVNCESSPWVVVTVLPIQFEHLFSITKEQENFAKGFVDKILGLIDELYPIRKMPPQNFKIMAYLQNENSLKMTELGRIDSRKYDHRFDLLLNDEDFPSMIRLALIEKNLKIEQVKGLFLKYSDKVCNINNL